MDAAEQRRKRDEADAEAASANAAAGLPALQGTEKQIAWAESIRTPMIADCDRIAAQIAGYRKQGIAMPHMDEIEPMLADIRATTSAAWWIDHRNDTIKDILAKRIKIK